MRIVPFTLRAVYNDIALCYLDGNYDVNIMTLFFTI